MSCFPELTYAIYLDGELPPEQARSVEAHLATCEACRARLAAFRNENILLAQALEELEESAAAVAAPTPPRGWRLLDLAWTTALVLAVAAGVNTVSGWLADVETIEGTGWLNPLNLGVQLNVFFNSLFYFLREGASMVASLTTTASTFILIGAVLGGAWLIHRRRQMPHTLVVALTVLFALVLAVPASAVDHRTQKRGTITVKADEVVDDTLVVHAEKVIIDGTVTGNLIVFGGGVQVNGTVKGDLIFFAGGGEVKGTVEGNVFAFTGGLNITGKVGESVYAFSGGANIESGALVGGDVVAFAGGVNQQGAVNRDLVTFAEGTSVGGTVGRHVRARTEKLSVLSSARVGGDLIARVEKQEGVSVEPGAAISGKTDIQVLPHRRIDFLHPRFYIQKVIGLGIIFLLGLLLFRFFPLFRSARLAGGAELAKTLGVGFLACVAPPVAAVVLCVTLVGIGVLARAFLIALLIPLLITVLWLLTLYLAKVLVAVAIGQAITKSPLDATGVTKPLLLGLVVVYILISLPYLGQVLNLGVWLLGLGMGVLLAWRHRKAPLPA